MNRGARVLVVGQGAREHALAWALSRSPHVAQVFVSPGNAGTIKEPNVLNIPLAPDQVDAIARYSREQHIDLVVIGPEAPLVGGLVDRLDQQGTAAVGPTQSLARLEGSKIYCKRFCEAHDIPTAAARIHTDLHSALQDIANHDGPLVIKASGLCGGKGVVVAQTRSEAEGAAHVLFSLPATREGLIIETCIQGWETSYIVLAHGTTYRAWPAAQDHKRLLAGDRGPNTGGMGALSPSPRMTPALEARICKSIIEPTLAALEQAQTPYRGFLYAGIMVDKQGDPYLLEFNCRLGDPEAQVLIFRLESDLYEILDAGARGHLDAHTPHWIRDPALAVVLASSGYPGPGPAGEPISGLEATEGPFVKVFHAGTRLGPTGPLTDGGRVLSITATGTTIDRARQRAYASIEQIAFVGMQYRKDIGLAGIS